MAYEVKEAVRAGELNPFTTPGTSWTSGFNEVKSHVAELVAAGAVPNTN